MEHADKKGRVFFMHIPQAYDEPTIELGRDIAVAYISALADDPLLT